MFSWEIKGYAIYIKVVSNSKRAMDYMQEFFQTHNKSSVPYEQLPPKRVFLIHEKSNGSFVVRFSEHIRECNSCDELLGIAVDWFYNEVSTEKFFYLHGGAVSKDNSCIVLLAPSNMGKTTIVMELLKRGYKYCSDDIIPIFKENLTVCSFPKPLFFRSNSPHIGNANIKIRKEAYERLAFIPKNIESSPCSLTCAFILNRNRQYEDNPCVIELFGVEKIKSILYNIYAVTDTNEAITHTMRLLRQTKVCKLNYYTSVEAISCLEAYVGL